MLILGISAGPTGKGASRPRKSPHGHPVSAYPCISRAEQKR